MEDFNLKEMLTYFLKKAGLIFFVAAIIFTSLELYTCFKKVPLYMGQTTLVLTKEDDGNSSTITQNDITLNQKLVTTYSKIMKSRRVLDQVIERTGLKCSNAELSNKITVSNVTGTEIIQISVSDIDPNRGAIIANTLAEVFTTEIVNIYKISNIAIIDKAVANDTPYNISIVKDSIIFAGLGIVAGLGLVFVIFCFDTSVKSIEDIENKLELPVLGTVPKYKHKKRKSKKDKKKDKKEGK